MTSESSQMMSRTVLIDGDESSPDASEFRMVRSIEHSAHADHDFFDHSVAVDASSVETSAVTPEPSLPASPPPPPDAEPTCTTPESDVQFYRVLERQLNEESALLRTKKFLDDENELLFRRFLAREERRSHQQPSYAPPCVQSSAWFKSLMENFSWWFPPAPPAQDLWRSHGVRQCDCLGGPQGVHRPDCSLKVPVPQQ